MDQKNVKIVLDDATKFLADAERISNSILSRDSHSKKIDEYIKLSFKLEDKYSKTIRSISEANITLRNQCNIIGNVCMILNLNVKKQKKIIEKLKKLESDDPKTEKRLMYKILILAESLQKGLSLIQHISERNNEIVFLDFQISIHKELFQERLNLLKNMSPLIIEKVEDDMKQFASGKSSLSNLTSKLSQLQKMIKERDGKSVTDLVNIVNKELVYEEEVNRSVTSQIKNVERLSQFIDQLLDDSMNVKDLVDTKNLYFKKNLELVAEIAVILSLEMIDFLKSMEIIDEYKFGSVTSVNVRRLLNNLVVFIKIACSNIESLVDLNHYMVELFDSNAVRESRLIELTQMDVKCYERLKEEAYQLTQTINNTLDGSEKNVINGQMLLKSLEGLLGQIKMRNTE